MILTQSLVRGLERGGCPRKFQAENITKELTKFTSEEMLKGSLLEFLCLGGGAGYSENITDLKRLRDGKKSADHLRIEKQANKFLKMVDPNEELFIGFEIIERQLVLEVGGIKGTIDFIAVDKNGIKWIFDLKSTADIDTGMWSIPEEIDMIQLCTYYYLYLEKHPGETVKCGYFILDYSPRMNVAIYEVNVSEQAIVNMRQRFNNTETAMMEYDLLEEWPRVPNPNDCRYCKLDCPVKINKAGYIYKSISI